MSDTKQLDGKYIGQNLKDCMNYLDITQTDLAEKCGLTQAAISQIINSERVPSIGSVIKILRVLPMSFERLIREPK
jgi:transcriptional regulator with XRE-family HTH domain